MSNEAEWKRIVKSYASKESWAAQRSWDRQLRYLMSTGSLAPKQMEILGERPELVEAKPKDPSIQTQLREAKRADPLNIPLLTEAYMEAVRKCPEASEGTRRKWRKCLGLG